ncbi:MAG: SpoIID/LytB domain-containing protein [Clostridia bacterium]|nr:SpoIID/LytB domain-containing protein [Clostridia bacterium]
MSKDKTAISRSERRKKMTVRVVASILAFLMIAGMAYSTIYYLVTAVSAEETEQIEVIDTSSLKNSGDVLISVGLMFGSNLTTGFQTTTEEGYIVGIQETDGDKEFEEIWEIDETKISCTADDNLSKTYMTYLIAEDEDETVIGGYHIQVDADHLDREELEELIDDTQRKIHRLGLYIIPSYIYTGYALRIGSFASYEEAEDYFDDVAEIYDDEYVSIVSPARTCVSVLAPDYDEILFEYDCGGETELGLMGMEDDNGNTYITTPAGNQYDGVFCFSRYNNGEVDGVQLVNILPLEAYVAGVLPYETSNSWPIETQKAFAVTVRSYTLTHLNKHSSYGFDLCNTTDCQVYKGAGKINDRVLEAVLDTEGMVMTYDDEIVTAYYASSMGGVTVSAADAWGQDIPYLQAMETPWENYMVHNNGFWIVEASPEEITTRLNNLGYDEIEGDVEEIEITGYGDNSTYVTEMTIIDEYGNELVIEKSDNVRIALSTWLKSANFVVGRGEVEYTENVIVSDYEEEEYEDFISYDDMAEGYGLDYGYINLGGNYVLTDDGWEEIEYEYGDETYILTDEGQQTHKKKDIFVMSHQNAAAFLGDEYLKYVTYEEEEEDDDRNIVVNEDKSTSEVLYKVAYADDEDNFIFVGKGWGHGVGMSQYGARDMAGMGYDAEEILAAYFKDTEIMHYEDSDNFN